MWGNSYKGKAVSTFFEGHYMASKMEATYAQQLSLRKKAGDIKDWEYQHQVEIEVYGKLVCKYKLDFRVIHMDDSIELVEVKGLPTTDWRLKWKLFSIVWGHEHPEIKLTVIYPKDL